MIRAATAMLLLAAATPAAAQVREDEQLWINVSAQGAITDDTVWVAEFQPRFDDGVSRNSVLLGRIAAGWKLSDTVTILQGYVHQQLPGRDGARDRNEERSYQQLTWNAASGRWGALISRVRFEQRWFSDGSDVGLRLRHQTRFERPLGDDDTPLVAVATAESLWNLRDADYGARRGIEAVRLFGGLRVPLADRHSIETGYQAQITNDPGRAASVAHILLVTLNLRP